VLINRFPRLAVAANKLLSAHAMSCAAECLLEMHEVASTPACATNSLGLQAVEKLVLRQTCWRSGAARQHVMRGGLQLRAIEMSLNGSTGAMGSAMGSASQI